MKRANLWPLAFLVALIILEGAVAVAYRRALWPARAYGTIVLEGVEVYWDPEGLANVTEVDWGRLRPGENGTVLVYIRNVGNEASNLTLWTSSWSTPDADKYLSLSWNYTGQVLQVLEMIPVELILAVDPEIEGVYDFSFTIGISIATVEGP